ncbi:MAG: MgtC/SapB family protein [Synergistaceae bacterium]|nr:MgtC/SapB family protein [Synergistaceae bacterium]
MGNSFIADPLAPYLGSWTSDINVYSILFRIFLAVTLAALIGCERSSKRHSAGLRTFILISMASAVAAMVDLSIMNYNKENFAAISAASVVSVAMISGNSILFSSRSQIKGLTTSAGLWASGIIGLATGAGLYTITFVSFFALLVCISQLPRIERILKDRSNHFEVHLELKNSYNLQDFITTIRKLGLKIDDIESNPAYSNSGLSVYSVSITIRERDFEKYKKHRDIIEALRSLDYIHHIEEMS